MNIFIEGIQGSGKSTAVNLIANADNRYICIREGIIPRLNLPGVLM